MRISDWSSDVCSSDLLGFVKRVVLVDVEVTHFLLLGLAGRERAQRRPAEECHFHVLREAVKAEKPDLVLDAVEGRVPFHRLAHAGDGGRDERSEEHTSELQSLMRNSYAVFCLKTK